MNNLNEKGHVMIFITLAFVILGFFVGLATDGGRGYLLRAELTRTVDAAAIAAASRITTGGISAAEDAACDAASMNGVVDCSNLVVTQVTVNDASGNAKDAVQVTGTASTPTIFTKLGKLIGCGTACDSINVSASAVAASGVGLIDLAMNLDNTGSMAGAKIANAKIGGNALVDAILPNGSGGTNSPALVSLVPFQGCYHATPGSSSPAVDPNCIDSNEYPNSGGDIVSLTSDATRLHNGINALTAPGGSGTNVCEGLKRTRTKLFESGVARPNASRFIIQLTDAENNFLKNDSDIVNWVSADCKYTGSSTDSDVWNRDLGVKTAALAAEIKNPTFAADGQSVGETVKIFVIMYGPNATGTVPATCNTSDLSTGSPTSASYTKNLARCIASSAGDVYLAPNASDISAAFQQIISRLPVLLLN
jgi:Putative Flp pilus-assembly TadE/G-like